MRLASVVIAVVAAAAVAAPFAPAAILSHQARGNRVDFQLSDGAAVLQWITASSFRFCRTWNANALCGFPRNKPAVKYAERDTATEVEFATEFLVVRIRKDDLRLQVRRVASNDTLFEEAAPLSRTQDHVVQNVKFPADEILWGLNAELDDSLNLAGRKLVSSTPFLMSSAGFGLFYTLPGAYHFDLAASASTRLTVEVPGGQIDYLLYYGPRQKDIYEQHKEILPLEEGDPQFESDSEWMPRYASALAPTGSVCGAVRELVSAALSGVRVPALDLEPFRSTASPGERRRALEFATLVPFLFHFSRDHADEQALVRRREPWRPYLVTYLQESYDRGYPMIHPLPMQFPEDARASTRADEFLIGDEVLVAPACGPAARRDVYLPRGVWTDLRTNEVLRGRQVVSTDAATLPLFARNGSIVVLRGREKPALLELHYFPRLAAEFFLTELDLGEVSQFHASPAGDLLRLEIESKRDRPHEWIVHHWSGATSVRHNGVELKEVTSAGALAAGSWYYDSAQQNLHIRLDARAGGDDIVNVID